MASRHTLRAVTALLLAAGIPALAATMPAASAVAPAARAAVKPVLPATEFLDVAPVEAVIVATPMAGKSDAQHGGEAIQFSAGACKYSGRVHLVSEAAAPVPTGFLDKLMALGRSGPAQHWEGVVQLATCAIPGAGLNMALAAYSFEASSVGTGGHVKLVPMKVPVIQSHHTPPRSVVQPVAIKLPSGYVPLPPAQAEAQEKVRSAAEAASATAVFEAAKARAALMASGTKVVKTAQVIPGVRPNAPAIPASDVAALAAVSGASGATAIALPVMARPAAAPQAPAPAGTVVNAAGISQKASLAMFASAAQARAAQAGSPAAPPVSTTPVVSAP